METVKDHELDDLVAEKVMCLRLVDDDSPFVKLFKYKRRLRIVDIYGLGEKIGEVRMAIPAYTADIAVAWRVVEKMRDEGFNLCMEYLQLGARAKFYSDPEVDPFVQGDCGAYLGIPARAICLAALKAKGVRV